MTCACHPGEPVARSRFGLAHGSPTSGATPRDAREAARRQGDERIASHVAASLAQALVARGELEDAAEVVAEANAAPPCG